MKKVVNIKKLTSGLIFAMATPLMLFSSEYILKTEKIFSKDNKEMGIVYKGAEVEKDGDLYKITAWVMEGNEYILFYSKDERIKLVRIDRTFIKDQKILEKTVDVYDVEWKKINFEFKTKEDLTVKDEKDLWVQENELYLRCGSCHSLHPYNEFNANQWPPIIKTMENNAGYTKEESQNVSIFLQYKSLEGNSHE